MSKAKNKHLAVAAVMLSLVLCAAAFAFSGARTSAKAANETELTMPASFAHDASNNCFNIPVPELEGCGQGHTDQEAAAEILAKVYVRRGESTFASSHVYTWNKLSIYFNNSGYVSNAPQAGDVFVIQSGFAFSIGGARFVCTEGMEWTYSGAMWIADYVPATAITVENENALTVNKGAALQLQVSLTPADADDVITYTALDSGVSVSSAGLVTGNTVGTSQVKIAAGNVEKTVSITVKTPPTVQSISVDGSLTICQYANITELSEQTDFSALTGQLRYSDGTSDTFTVEASMLSGWDAVQTDTAGNYTVTVKKDTFTASVPVVVKKADVLTFVNSGGSGGNVLWVMFSGSKATLTMNAGDSLSPEAAAMLNSMRPYVQATLATDTANNLQLAMQANYSPEAGKRTVNLYWQPGGQGAATHTRGDTVTLKKGFPILTTERLAADISFVYDGAQWVQLIEPTQIVITNKKTTLFQGVTHALQVTTQPDNANGILTFESSNAAYASVDAATGVITPHKLTDQSVPSVTVTVRYKDLSDSITFTVTDEPVATGIEIEDKIPAYYVPVSTPDKPTSLLGQGFELTYHVVYEDGRGPSEKVTAAHLGAFDYTQTGDRELTVTVDGFTDTVTVHVYEPIAIGAWKAIGVDGYGDDRNIPGQQFNGNFLITANNYSSSRANIKGGDQLEEMLGYMKYTTVSGEEYTFANQKLGMWLLGSTILISVNGKGFTGQPENGYMLGDKIVFEKGMPLYGWSGEIVPQDPDDPQNPNKIKEGTGCMYVIGYLDDTYTYFCYEQDSDKSLWVQYIPYEGIHASVKDSITITVEGVGALGALTEPMDATVGYFTYRSDDTSVVTVSDKGNLVGVGKGTAHVTITLLPTQASGYVKDPITKVVTVTVENGIRSVSGSFTVKKGKAFDLDNNKITVTYTDGTTEEIALSDERVQAEEVDTSVLGESTYVVMVTVDGVVKRGTFTVTVKKEGGCGCGSSVAASGLGLGGLAVALSAVLVCRNKKKKA